MRKSNPTERNYGSPNKLSPQLRDLWDRTYRSAMNLYSDSKFAEGTAWRAVRMAEGRERVPNSTEGLPDFGDMIILGKLIEVAYLSHPPEVTLLKFRKGQEPDLLWSRSQMTLVAFPQMSTPVHRNPGLVSPQMRREYQRWSQRAPSGAAQISYRSVPMHGVAPADTVVYRSSKWTDVQFDPEGSQEYIHQFGENVVLSRSAESPVSALTFRGGKLDVLPAGIVN